MHEFKAFTRVTSIWRARVSFIHYILWSSVRWPHGGGFVLFSGCTESSRATACQAIAGSTLHINYKLVNIVWFHRLLSNAVCEDMINLPGFSFKIESTT